MSEDFTSIDRRGLEVGDRVRWKGRYQPFLTEHGAVYQQGAIRGFAQLDEHTVVALIDDGPFFAEVAVDDLELWPEEIDDPDEDPVEAFYRERGGGRPATMAQELAKVESEGEPFRVSDLTTQITDEDIRRVDRSITGRARRLRIFDLHTRYGIERDRRYVPSFFDRQPYASYIPALDVATRWESDHDQSRMRMTDIGGGRWLVEQRKGEGPWMVRGRWEPGLREGLGGWMRKVDELAEKHREEPTEGAPLTDDLWRDDEDWGVVW